jgi:hypothetical protein
VHKFDDKKFFKSLNYFYKPTLIYCFNCENFIIYAQHRIECLRPFTVVSVFFVAVFGNEFWGRIERQKMLKGSW